MPSESDWLEALEVLRVQVRQVEGVQGVGMPEDENGLFLAIYVEELLDRHAELPGEIAIEKAGCGEARFPVKTVVMGKLKLV